MFNFVIIEFPLSDEKLIILPRKCKFPESFSGPTLKSRRAHYTLAILDYRLTGANQELSTPTHVTKDLAIMKDSKSSIKMESK